MYNNNRDAYREQFYTAWQKYQHHLSLTPVEAQIVAAISAHPEYQTLLTNKNQAKSTEYAVAENPFVHLSLHISVAEQIKMDKPNGIREIYQKLCEKMPSAHHVEHAMMEALGTVMWQAQMNGLPPDENTYLQTLRELLL